MPQAHAFLASELALRGAAAGAAAPRQSGTSPSLDRTEPHRDCGWRSSARGIGGRACAGLSAVRRAIRGRGAVRYRRGRAARNGRGRARHRARRHHTGRAVPHGRAGRDRHLHAAPPALRADPAGARGGQARDLREAAGQLAARGGRAGAGRGAPRAGGSCRSSSTASATACRS